MAVKKAAGHRCEENVGMSRVFDDEVSQVTTLLERVTQLNARAWGGELHAHVPRGTERAASAGWTS